jgi:hypothetical protein
MIYHYLTLVVDHQTNIGCAMSKYIDEGFKTTLIVCNYSTTNIHGEPVFDTGRLASKCKTGENPEYRGLCSVDEEIDVNNYRWAKECNN